MSTNNNSRCILLLDSNNMGAKIIEPDLRKFVYDIFQAYGRAKTKDDIYHIPLLAPEVAQQENDVDCGRFVLYFIKQFLDDAPVDSSKSSLMSSLIKLTPDSFSPECFAQVCDKLDEDEELIWQPIAKPVRRRSQRIKNAELRQRKPREQGTPQIVIIEDDFETSS